MCGRASLARTNPDEIADQLDADLDPRARVGWRARYNLAPTQTALIVVPGERRRLVQPATWGWKRVVGPPRQDGKPAEKLLINAMAETAADKVTFKKALRERRAVMPVTGYYEWTGPPRDRRPIHFTARDGRLLLLGCLWSQDKDVELPSLIVLTTAANEAVRGIHDRMPVLIPPERLDQWLATGGAELMAPAPPDFLAAALASRLVNGGGEGPACWEPDEEAAAQAEASLQTALALFGPPAPKA